MSVNDFYRMSLAEATRRMKRSKVFRHVLFAVGELHDPIEPDPFNMQGLLPAIEREWHFRRDAVPEYIKLYVGMAARERSLAGLMDEYLLPPAERFGRLKGTLACNQYSPRDPSSWDTPFFTVIQVPGELTDNSAPIFWCGNRSTALSEPRVRSWFFDPRSTVTHGAEAVALARAAVSKAGGLR